MDVLFVSSTLQIGGSEAKIVRIANALAQSGYATAIAYLNPPDTLLGNIDPSVSVQHLHRRGKFSFRSLRRLRDCIGSQCRVVFSVNFYPLLYVLPAVKLFPRAESKVIGLVNTTDFLRDQRDWGRIYAPFLRRCDQIVYGCHEQQVSWTDRYKLPMDRSIYVHNGVDLSVFSPDAKFRSARRFRAELGVPEDALVIGSFGRFAPEKNFDLLIDVVSKLIEGGRDAYLVLVGDGQERASLEKAAAMRGISAKVFLPGFLNDIRPAIDAMDIFVLPSCAVETFSNAALEAMAMARPVVLSNIGGAAEMVEHDISGYLFDVGNAPMLARTLAKLYDSKPERDRIGFAARRRVEEQFSFRAMVHRYEALIESEV